MTKSKRFNSEKLVAFSIFNEKHIIPLEQRAHFYTVASPVCALCEADSPDDGSPGCFASLRSEQGAAPLAASPIPAYLSFGNGFDKPFLNDKSEKSNTLHRPFTDLR